jgi:REP element-mobilizing transposase RayT
MGRKPRLHIEGGLYHIIARGNNRKEIFKEKEDYADFLKNLQALKEKTSFKLFGYCLMPNHFHLLMEVGRSSTSVVMQRLLTSYTKHFNKKYNKIGHLFQGRYKSIICEKDSYLLELVRYIHLNPFRAGLVNRPLDWEWSGHKEYFVDNSKLVDNMEVLGMLGANLKQAVKNYADFVRDGSKMGKRKNFYPEEKMPYVGSDAFIDDLAIQHEDLITNRLPEKRIDIGASLKDILARVAKENNVLVDSVVKGVKTSDVTKARTLFIVRAMESGYKGKDIAGLINCSESNITKVKMGVSKAS